MNYIRRDFLERQERRRLLGSVDGYIRAECGQSWSRLNYSILLENFLFGSRPFGCVINFDLYKYIISDDRATLILAGGTALHLLCRTTKLNQPTTLRSRKSTNPAAISAAKV